MKQLYYAALLLLAIPTFAQTHYQGPIIDMHVHVAIAPGESGSLGGPNEIKDILPVLKAGGVTRAGLITIARAPGDMENTRRRNDSIIALCKQYPAMIPICSVHPEDTTAAWAELARVHALGVQVIKLHPNAQHFDVASPAVADLATAAGKLHMILLFDSYNPSDASELGKLLMLAVTHPDARFIFAHTGFIHFEDALLVDAWKRYSWYNPNWWFDVSAIAPILGNSPYHDRLLWVMHEVGMERFLFGSDYPLFTPKETIDAVHKMGFTAKEEQLIFHDNAVTLLGL